MLFCDPRLEDKGIIVQFIIGHTDDAEEEQKMNEEEKKNKDIMRLPIKVRTHICASLLLTELHKLLQGLI